MTENGLELFVHHAVSGVKPFSLRTRVQSNLDLNPKYLRKCFMSVIKHGVKLSKEFEMCSIDTNRHQLNKKKNRKVKHSSMKPSNRPDTTKLENKNRN